MYSSKGFNGKLSKYSMIKKCLDQSSRGINKLSRKLFYFNPVSHLFHILSRQQDMNPGKRNKRPDAGTSVAIGNTNVTVAMAIIQW
jgi:hypothetical protein